MCAAKRYLNREKEEGNKKKKRMATSDSSSSNIGEPSVFNTDFHVEDSKRRREKRKMFSRKKKQNEIEFRHTCTDDLDHHCTCGERTNRTRKKKKKKMKG